MTLASLARVQARVYQMRAKYHGLPVTATEPVFGPMAAALGLDMRNRAFQTAMMNDTEPSARDLAAFENDLKQHKVKALIYNRQVSEKLTERLIAIAKKAKVPVVRGDRNAARRHQLRRLDAGAARRARQGAGGALFVTDAVALDRVTLRLGGRDVLKDVSFAIRPGEFIGVLGPNGAGKTTLMRAILGLCPPSAGTLRVFGHAPRLGDGSIGYLPQVRTVLPDLRLRGMRFHRLIARRRALGPAASVAAPTTP